jgi:uncharacterized membrane protein YhaH (DUF805 family)
VNQQHYAGFGFSLMFMKYLVEALVIAGLTGKIYTPLDFVNPLVSSRERFTADAPLWLGMGWVLWTLPFLWIAVSMSVRRAAFLGYSPWWGLLVLVPIFNLVTMLVLACISDPGAQRATDQEEAEKLTEAYRPPPSMSYPVPRRTNDLPLTSGIIAALLGLAGGAGFLVIMVVLSVYLFESYGAVMFFGTPIVTGAIAAFSLNSPIPRSLAATVGHSILTLTVACLAFLFFGLEGAICIIMAIPIMVPLGLLGAFVGYAIAIGLRRPGQSEFQGMMGTILLLPLFGAAEAKLQPTPTFVVLTAIEIQATPEQVWEHVVQFSDITETPEWYFRLGFATPLRARIEGRGVGALRYCEFTTGTFVEPITAWEAPHRLAFDVTEQPEPMFELTPYRHIHPPHLDHSFRSLRGEFRIVPLQNGKVRLEGRTWYQLQIYPLAYWSMWSDAIVHRIHSRVLRHIKKEAEQAVNANLSNNTANREP